MGLNFRCFISEIICSTVMFKYSGLNLDIRIEILDYGRGTWDMGRGTWDMGHGTWDVGRGTWDMGRGTWDMGLRTKD